MKKFNFTADILLDAKDLDDAFAQLSKHFAWLMISHKVDDPGPWFEGQMNITKVEDPNAPRTNPVCGFRDYRP